jgi:hydroxyacylglutathione hydrolase
MPDAGCRRILPSFSPNKGMSMKPLLARLLTIGLLIASGSAWSQLVPGSMEVHWNEGAEDCAAHPQPAIQVYRYNEQTFILRESLCATFEAPFMYLLTGSTKALLIDTGDVADPNQMPLAQTVTDLLPGTGASKVPLIVVHTHGHLDHRAGDSQFQHVPNTQVVPADLDHVRKYFGLADWPNGIAQVDLGDRTIDVIPTPGHYPSHISFYDRNTGLFFSGDFLLPGRLLLDDVNEDRASARRAADFVRDRPISHVMGGHIEMNLDGETFPWGSNYHPRERPLQMTKEDLLKLPGILSGFHFLYAERGGFAMIDQPQEMWVLGVAVIIVLVALGMLLRWYLRRRRNERKQPAFART